MSSTSPEPFRSYPGGGRELIGRIADDSRSTRRGAGQRFQQLTAQESCAYCGMSLTGSFDQWLQLQLDYAVPVALCQSVSIPAEWAEDCINRVLACAACNAFRPKYTRALPKPATLEEFCRLRDLVFTERAGAVLQRRRAEIEQYRQHAWRVNPSIGAGTAA